MPATSSRATLRSAAGAAAARHHDRDHRGHPDRAPRRSPLVALLAVLACALLAGCGVRLDSPAPGPRTPSADEVARAATVTELLAVQDQARRTLRAGAHAGVDTAVRHQLTDLVARVDTQVEALGGVYEGPAPTARTTSSPAATGTPRPATVAGVVSRLATDDAHARARLARIGDPHLARLVAQVGTSQALAARTLARTAHLSAPRAAATLPARVPATLPAGARASSVATLVTSEDGAGYVLEVLAARASGSQRASLVARAALHRARAQAWADAAGLSGTPDDPRRTAYTVPAKNAARTVESGLVAQYATLLDTLGPDGRTPVADLLTDAARAAADAGAATTALPGSPAAARGR